MPDDYIRQWEEYRRRRRQTFRLALGLAFLAAVWLLVDEHQWLEPPLIGVALLLLGAAAVAGWRFGLWPCPRCRRPFGIREWWYTESALITRRCLHCGLQKWAVSDSDASIR